MTGSMIFVVITSIAYFNKQRGHPTKEIRRQASLSIQNSMCRGLEGRVVNSGLDITRTVTRSAEYRCVSGADADIWFSGSPLKSGNE